MLVTCIYLLIDVKASEFRHCINKYRYQDTGTPIEELCSKSSKARNQSARAHLHFEM